MAGMEIALQVEEQGNPIKFRPTKIEPLSGFNIESKNFFPMQPICRLRL